MNRQAVAVTLGTLALVVVGAILLYATPSTDATRVTPAPPPGKAAKQDKSAKRLDEGQLVHEKPLPADRAAAPAGAPNVVLVVASTQRRDQWTVYGGPPNVTPFLARQAATGVVMQDALSVAVDPKASSAAIVTGRYPHAVGVQQLGDGKKIGPPISEQADTLAERLAAAGWFTVGLSASHHLNKKAGGAQGFDWYRDSQPFSLMLEQRIDAGELVQKAVERVGARTDDEKARPLFLQLAFVDSHKPFKVPPAEFQPFQGDGAEVAPYRATVKRLDDALQRLTEGLAAHGVTRDDTLFVVIADHGEGLDMPVAHRKQHGFVLYGSSVRIPWVWWGKGVASGHQVEGPVSQVDLVPTLLKVVGVEPPEGLDGVDHSAAVTGKASVSTRPSAYADSLFEGMNRASIWTRERQCQKDYGSRAVDDDSFQDGCFDRKADPDFTTPVVDATLTAELDRLHADLVGRIAPAKAGKEAK